MKFFRILTVAGLISLPHMAFGQAAPTDAQRIFTAMKGLAGSWVGQFTTVPAMPTPPSIGDSMRATLRVLSRGNTLVHEMQGANTPDDPTGTKYDHPVTVIYLNEDGKLTLTHYCDAGNRPRMTARISADGKVIDFDFVDVSGKYDRTGHMQHATFTFVDSNHHIEEWTYLMPNNQTMRGRFELKREPVVASSSR
jgi:hypothetical protein